MTDTETLRELRDKIEAAIAREVTDPATARATEENVYDLVEEHTRLAVEAALAERQAEIANALVRGEHRFSDSSACFVRDFGKDGAS